jgi:hypothetical protein
MQAMVIDRQVLVFTAAVAMLTGIVFEVLMRVDPTVALRSE